MIDYQDVIEISVYHLRYVHDASQQSLSSRSSCSETRLGCAVFSPQRATTASPARVVPELARAEFDLVTARIKSGPLDVDYSFSILGQEI